MLREQAQDVRRQAGDLPVYYTEWSSSSNPRDPLHDEPYAAAFAVKTILEVAGLVQGYGWWTFSNLFEEKFFPAQPFHGGFGLLNLQGVAKPVYRAFELLHGVEGEQLRGDGAHPTVDAWVVRGRDRVTAIVTNFNLPRHPVRDERVEIVLERCAAAPRASWRRIDARHAHAKAAWQRQREPAYPSAAQLARLARASEVVARPLRLRRARTGVAFAVRVPPQGVAAIDLRLRRDGR